MLLVILLFVAGYVAHKEGWLDGTVVSLHPSMELDPGTLSGAWKESDLSSKYPKLDWDCYDEKTPMGDRVCTAPIRAWNGVLAKYTAFFFNKRDRLNLVKFAFKEAEHPKVLAAINAKYGQPREVPGQKDNEGKPLVVWPSGDGLITTSENAEGEGEATMTWTSGRALMERVFKRIINGE